MNNNMPDRYKALLDSVGGRIKLERLAVSMNQSELAVTAGVHRPYLNRLEQNDPKLRPPCDVLRAIADALDVSVDYLLLRSDIPTLPNEAELPTEIPDDVAEFIHVLQQLNVEERAGLLAFVRSRDSSRPHRTSVEGTADGVATPRGKP